MRIVTPVRHPSGGPVPDILRKEPSEKERPSRMYERRKARAKLRKAELASTYRRRRLAAGLVALAVGALVVAALLPERAAGSGAERVAPINPSKAGPKATLASVGGVGISTPIRPQNLTGLGYHPQGEGFLGLNPEGTNLSANPLFAIFSKDSSPEKVRYYEMDSAGRAGSSTGALDVGAKSGAKVYAPVDGTITAIRQDPSVTNANVVEIQPSKDPNLRVSVWLVKSSRKSAGVRAPVEAGKTQLGVVADSAAVLHPQLSDYTKDAGNHVTLTALNAG